MVQFDEILFDIGAKINVVGVDCYLIEPTVMWGSVDDLQKLRIETVVNTEKEKESYIPRRERKVHYFIHIGQFSQFSGKPILANGISGYSARRSSRSSVKVGLMVK